MIGNNDSLVTQVSHSRRIALKFGASSAALSSQPSSLQGNGVLGRPVEFVVADTQGNNGVANALARQLIQQDGVSVLIGGASSNVAIISQSISA